MDSKAHDVSGQSVEGGTRLPSAGAGYSDQQVFDLINFQEWLDEQALLPEFTYEDIAKAYLEHRYGG